MTQRIAIVGSGISGLTAARLLDRRHDITVYEADDRIGGHSHTVEVEADGAVHGVDTGFIVYNRRTYPNFCRLLDELGVDTQPSDMSFGYRDEATGLEYAAPEPRRLFAQKRNLLRPSFWRMLREILRFYREAPRLLEAAEDGLTLGDYLRRERYATGFVRHHLYPVIAAIWSSPGADVDAYPAAALVRFFQNHGLLSLTDRPRWRTVTGGSRRYVEALVAPFAPALRPGCPVRRIERDEAGVTVLTDDAPPERYDHVVLACHADQALDLLAAPTDREREMLGAFRYAPNDTVLHTDARTMPRRRTAWASWNYRRPAGPDDRVVVTYHMNRLQSLPARTPLLVTLNPAEIDPARVRLRQIYHHPQYDARAVALQSAYDDVGGRNRTHYCGAYWGYGFHEDGVASGLRVARAFGEEP